MFPCDDVAGPIDELGALLTFAPNPDRNQPTSILARVGVSLISIAQACSNAESEIPNFDFQGTEASARATWNDLLGRVQVSTEGVEAEIVQLFYSSVSHSYMSSIVSLNFGSALQNAYLPG